MYFHAEKKKINLKVMQVNFPTTSIQAVKIISKQTYTVRWLKLWFVRMAWRQQSSCLVLGKFLFGSLYEGGMVKRDLSIWIMSPTSFYSICSEVHANWGLASIYIVMGQHSKPFGLKVISSVVAPVVANDGNRERVYWLVYVCSFIFPILVISKTMLIRSFLSG